MQLFITYMHFYMHFLHDFFVGASVAAKHETALSYDILAAAAACSPQT
jgi:hypothetical protein